MGLRCAAVPAAPPALLRPFRAAPRGSCFFCPPRRRHHRTPDALAWLIGLTGSSAWSPASLTGGLSSIVKMQQQQQPPGWPWPRHGHLSCSSSWKALPLCIGSGYQQEALQLSSQDALPLILLCTSDNAHVARARAIC